MKSKIGIFIGLIALMLTFASCTKNQKAKNWGGEYTIELPANTKLVEATWKNNDLWYLTRPMRPGETAETFNFIEDSDYGVMEGTVIFVESQK